MNVVTRGEWRKVKKRYLDLVDAKKRSRKEEKASSVGCETYE